MEHYIMALVSFVACVYAYTLGVKHGLGVNKGRAPQPIREAIQSVKSVAEVVNKEPELPDVIQTIMAYDYESALQAVKKEQLEARG